MGVCYTVTDGNMVSDAIDIQTIVRNTVFCVAMIAAVVSFAGLLFAGTDAALTLIMAATVNLSAALMSSERPMLSAMVAPFGSILSIVGVIGLF